MPTGGNADGSGHSVSGHSASGFSKWVKPAFSGLSEQQFKLDQQTADFEAKLSQALAAVEKRPGDPAPLSTPSSTRTLPRASAPPRNFHMFRGQSESDLMIPPENRCAICSNGKRIQNMKVEALIVQRKYEAELSRVKMELQTLQLQYDLELMKQTKPDSRDNSVIRTRLVVDTEPLDETKATKKQNSLVITTTPVIPSSSSSSSPTPSLLTATSSSFPPNSPPSLFVPLTPSSRNIRVDSFADTPRTPRVGTEVLDPKELELSFSASSVEGSTAHAFIVVFVQAQDGTFMEVGRTEVLRPHQSLDDPWATEELVIQRKRSGSPFDSSSPSTSISFDHHRPTLVWDNKVRFTVESFERVLKFEVYDDVSRTADMTKSVFLGESLLKISLLMGLAEKHKACFLRKPGILGNDSWDQAILHVKGFDATPEDSGKQVTRLRVATEILTTERSYLEGIVKLETHFGNALKQVISKEDYDTIFGAFGMIVGVNRELLKEIEAKLLNWGPSSTLGDVFLRFTPYFRLYSSYVSGHEKTERLIVSLSRNKAFRQVCEKGVQSSGGQLQSFLILPIQRIPRYVLLLTELKKATSKLHPDFSKLQEAIPLVQTVASAINKAISGAADELLSVQNSLNNCPDLLAPGRSLVRRGLLERLSVKKNDSHLTNNYRLKTYEFILMSDLILFAKPLTENLARSRSVVESGSSQETRNIAGQIVIDNHFFVQEADLEGPTVIVERKNKGVVSKAEIRHVFRIFSMSGIYMWMAETLEDKMRWLEVLQKTAGARQKEFEFKKLTGNILLDGLSMLVLSEHPDPQPSTLLFIPEVNTEDSHGWIQVRAWWDSEQQMVHVMLVEARELFAADSNGFSDPYVKLKAYSIEEQYALEHHARIHDDGKHTTGNAPRKLKPRWQAASKTIKKCLNPYWGESFSFPLSKNDRIDKKRQLLRLEVWDSNIVLKGTFLGQMTIDLTRVPEFTKATAPAIYTQMPEPKHEGQNSSRPMLSRRGSDSRSMRVLDLAKTDADDAIFYSLLHAQSSIAGCKGRIYWLDRGAVLLQKSKSFTTGAIIEVRLGAPPEEHVEPEDDGQFAIVMNRGDKQHVLQLEAHSRGAAENWVEQLVEMTPLIKVVDRPKELPKTQFLAPAVSANRAQDIRLLLST